MPVEQPETIGLREWKSKRQGTGKQIAEALDFESSTSAAFERPESLYHRCIQYANGFQDEEIDRNVLHKCVLAAIPIVRHKWPNVTLTDVRGELEKSLNVEVDVVDHAINIALCLWLSVDCVGQKYGRPKSWPDADTIYHFVLKRSFDDPTEADLGDSIVRFPPKFRAARLMNISGITIECTWYLDQHLRFNEETRTLKVFMDAAWLKFMCENLREIRDSPQEEPKHALVHDKSTQTSLPTSQSQSGSSAAHDSSHDIEPKESRIEDNKNTTTPGTEGGTSRKPEASGAR